MDLDYFSWLRVVEMSHIVTEKKWNKIIKYKSNSGTLQAVCLISFYSRERIQIQSKTVTHRDNLDKTS